MAWHIFRKDLILLWPLALLSALVQFGLAGLMLVSDQTPDAPYLLPAARLSTAVVFLVIALAIARSVHEDAVPGTRQDWLVRPIRRGDVLGAKLLFLLAAVQAPMLVGDVGEALAQGFPLGQALGAALVRNLHLLIALSLPILAFAAMTRTMVQFIAAGVVYFIALAAGTVMLNVISRATGQEQATNPLFWTGVAWIPQAAAQLALAAGAALALGLLYGRRRIGLARSLFPVFAVLSAVAVLIPWSWIFAAQQAASAQPRLPLDLNLELKAPRYRPAPGQPADDYAAGAAQVQLRGRVAGDIAVENQVRQAQGAVTIYAPVRISGLPAGALPWADRATVTLSSASGQVLYRGRGDALKAEGARPGSPLQAYEAIRVPALVFEGAKDRPLRLQIDYSMSVLAPRPAVAAPALDADVRLEGLGRCTSGRDSDGDDIELKCRQAGGAPSCLSAALTDAASGRRNPAALICAPDYAPFGARLFPDSLSRFEVEAPFRDRLGVAHYPVGAAQLGTAQVEVTPYRAVAHVSRSVSADIRLSDWTAAAS